MNIQEFLKACAETERLVGSFYAFLADRFSDHPTAAQIFRQMSVEEEAHARTFEFLRGVASREEFEITVRTSFLGNLVRLQLGLDRARSAVQMPDEATLLDAIGMANLLESTTLERDKGAFVEVADPEFQSLLHSLVVGDERHRRQLAALRESVEREFQEPRASQPRAQATPAPLS